MPDFEEVVDAVSQRRERRAELRKEIVGVDADNMRARLEHLADLYDALDVEWGSDPFTAIQNLRARAAKKAAALPNRQLFDSIPLFGYELVTRERIRQITQERFTEAHDDAHTDHSLAVVAALYAVADIEVPIYDPSDPLLTPEQRAETTPIVVWKAAIEEDAWPDSWDPRWDKRNTLDRTRELVIAGALICAEIDRLQRLADYNERAERARIVRELDPRADL
jgi:hypothetical protein